METVNIRYSKDFGFEQLELSLVNNKKFNIWLNELKMIPSCMVEVLKNARENHKIFKYGVGTQEYQIELVMSDYLKIIGVSKKQGNKEWVIL